MGGISIKKHVLIVVIIMFLSCCWIVSTVTFKDMLGDFFLKKGNLEKASFLYAGALRKECVDGGNGPKILSIELKFKSAYLAGLDSMLAKYSQKGSLSKPLIDEFTTNIAHYKHQIEKVEVISLYTPLKKVFIDDMKTKLKKTCYNYGEYLIEEQKWALTRYFYTEKIVQIIDPLEVLNTLKANYCKKYDDKALRDIWGYGGFYVVIEKVEGAPVFELYPASADKTIIKRQRMVKGGVDGGLCEDIHLDLKDSKKCVLQCKKNIILGGIDDFNVCSYVNIISGDIGITPLIRVENIATGQRSSLREGRILKRKTGWQEVTFHNVITRIKEFAAKNNTDFSNYSIIGISLYIKGTSGEIKVDEMTCQVEF